MIANKIVVMIGAVIFSLTAFAQEPVDKPAADPAESISLEIGTMGFDLWRHPGLDQWFLNEVESFKKAHPNIDISTFAVSEPRRYDRPLETLPSLARNVIGLQAAAGGPASDLWVFMQPVAPNILRIGWIG